MGRHCCVTAVLIDTQRLYDANSLYLNLKEEPRVKSTGLGLGLGSSKRRKKAWYSTQIFQKTLQQSLLAIRNSKVSWYELWGTHKNIAYNTRHWWVLYITRCDSETYLTFRSGLSLMRNRFLLKLSFRTLDQLKALIFVCPCRDEKWMNFYTSSFKKK